MDSAIVPGNIFVGRQRELGELRAALEESVAGRGRLVMLAGEPGIGKTRTAQELAANAVTRGAQVLWGRCYEEEGAPPYWPWVELIRSCVHETDPQKLRSQMGPGAADIAEIIPEVRQKLPDLEPPPPLAPEAARFRLFDSIAGYLKNAARSQPLVLVLDDLHWADEPSLLLLQFVARQMTESRLLVVGCYRDIDLSRQHPLSETLARLSREPVYQRRLLRGLGLEEIKRFIEAVAGMPVPRNLVEVIYSHTEGNPFFATEVIRLLLERGALGEDVTVGSQGVRIPESVREVIGQRLNRLSGECNRVLATASVVGKEFGLSLLERIVPDLSEEHLLEVMEEGLAAHVIEELLQPASHYRFTHRLVQETLTEELSLTRRVRLHARIAEALEELHAGDVEAHASVLAYHYAQAEAVTGTEKLVRYSLLAGEQALAAYAYEEAQAHFQRALASKEGLTMDAETGTSLFGLARAQLAVSGRFPTREALGSLQRAFEYYYDVGDVDRVIAVAEYPVHTVGGATKGVAGRISRALSLVPADSHEEARLLCSYGLTLYKETGDYDGAQDAVNRALAIAQREADVALEIRTLAGAAEVAWWQLRLPQAAEYGRRAVELSHHVDDPHSEVLARHHLARALAAMGNSEEAHPNCAAMLSTAEQLRDQGRLWDALWRNAELYFFRGQWQEARSYANRGAEELVLPLGLLSILALLEYETGDSDAGDVTVGRLKEGRGRAAMQFEGFT